MKNILYIGNNLSSKSSNISSIQVLGGLLEQEGFHLRYASKFQNKALRMIDMIVCVIKFCRRTDYVIIDTYSTHNFYYALVISQLCRVLHIEYIPNLNGGNLPARLENNPKFCKLIFRNALINVSPSYYLKDAFADYGYNNVRFVPNSIEISNYKFTKRSYDAIKLLWVRSFSKIYNPQMAIRLVKGLQDLNLNCELCMVGPDSDGSLKQVRKLADKLQVEVRFTGKLTKKEWIKLSEDYNIFINTTNFDNTPVSVIEAMALGLPVVSTNVGGIPYLISDRHDGLLVEKDDLEGMLKGVIYLYNNPATADEIGRSARNKVEQFDWQRVKNRWLEILV
ncbi:MAG: glycosyltransferase family 4 protein [Bacteroidia bacterium]|nr:glycosyltransferase family 4 protein [Bacteroidia bacterium]